MAKIPGTAVASPLVPNDDRSTRATHQAQYGKGGLRRVATIAALDDIPIERREYGMLVFVDSIQSYYQCGPSPALAFGAAPFVPGPGTDTIYANTTAGLAAVAEGEYFYVADSDSLTLYRDVAGVATEIGEFPTLATLAAQVSAASSSATDAETAQTAAEAAQTAAEAAQTAAELAEANAETAQTNAETAATASATSATASATSATEALGYRDQARAAADATPADYLAYSYNTTAPTAVSIAASAADGATILILADESAEGGGYRTIRKVDSLAVNNIDPTPLLIIEGDAIRTDLASTDAGKGAELVARLRADSMFNLANLPTPQTNGFGVDLRAFYSDTDTGGGRFYWDAGRDKSEANGGTIIDPDTVGTLSATALGTFLDVQGTGVGTGCWVRPRGTSNPDMFGARGKDETSDTAANVKCFSVGGDIDCGDSEYHIDISSESRVIKPATGTSAYFRGTKYVFGADSNYLPCFALVGVENVSMRGDLRFVNTGTLDGVESISTEPVTRLGATTNPNGFNNSIFIYSSNNNSIDGVSLEQADASAGITSTICMIDSTNNSISHVTGNGCSIVILAAGGGKHRISNIHSDFLNSYNSIPGHVIYAFISDSTITNITDGGVDTGMVQSVGHTVSLKAAKNTLVSNITSRRGAGIFNIDGCENCVASNLLWEDDELSPSQTAFNIVESGTFGPSKNNNFYDITLKTNRDVIPLFLRGSKNSVRAYCVRGASSPSINPFIQITNPGGFVEATCVTLGANPITTIKAHANTFRDNDMRITLLGDITTPSIDWNGISSGPARNRIKFSFPGAGNFWLEPIDYDLVYNGDQFIDRTSLFLSEQSFVNFKKSITGSPVSVNTSFQLPQQGVYLVSVTLLRVPNYTGGTTAMFWVVFDQQAGTGDFKHVQQIGTSMGKGDGTFGPIDLAITEIGVATVTATMTSPQDYDLQVGATRMSSWRTM